MGVYVLLPTRPVTVELVNIAVAEEQQGRGIGKQMVMHAIQTARRDGYSVMEVGTGNSSIGQLALYQKCGFRIVAVDMDFLQNIILKRSMRMAYSAEICYGYPEMYDGDVRCPFLYNSLYH